VERSTISIFSLKWMVWCREWWRKGRGKWFQKNI